MGRISDGMRRPSSSRTAAFLLLLTVVLLMTAKWNLAEILVETTRSAQHGDGGQTSLSPQPTWTAVLQEFVHDYQPWLCSVLASLAIGFSGILPLIVVPVDVATAPGHKQDGVPVTTLRMLLSFAVGGLLGDVFLHLLPEAWHHLALNGHSGISCYMTVGLWVLAGVFTFIVVEMMFDKDGNGRPATRSERYSETHEYNFGPSVSSANGAHQKNGLVSSNGTSANGCQKHMIKSYKKNEYAPLQGLALSPRHVTGYLNLLANSIDNFTHGLAVAGSFLVSFKVGLLTTFAILIHEIPHEIGDFAILLKCGFNRLEAAKAQMATATVGLAGAVAALSADSAQTLGDRTAWILPFTAGGFLNIALVNVLPDILQEKDPKESIKQLGCLFAGIGVMAVVTLFCG